MMVVSLLSIFVYGDMITPISKKCGRCQLQKDTSNFGKDSYTKDKFSNKCKQCEKELYLKNRERILLLNKVWRQNNKERLSAYNKIRDREVGRRLKKSIAVAKKRHLSWDITLLDFQSLCLLPCHYCNNILEDRGNSTYGALDRINNSIGYQLDNVLPSCATCNYLRGDILSVSETEELIKLLIQLRKL